MIKYLKKKILSDTQERLILAFQKVDSDINHLRGWLSHLHRKHDSLSKEYSLNVQLSRKDIGNINKWLTFLHNHNADVKKNILDLTRSLSEILAYNRNMAERLTKLEVTQNQVQPVQFTSSVRTEPRTEPVHRTAFERKITSEALSNRKNFGLNLILELAEKRQFTTVQIEKILVEDKHICGRTTFYAYLKELRSNGLLADATIGSKIILVRTKK